jgi:hypothetical protein
MVPVEVEDTSIRAQANLSHWPSRAVCQFEMRTPYDVAADVNLTHRSEFNRR